MDKDWHNSGQSEGGFLALVQRFTQPGDVIFDAFCGAGTTGVAALSLGRRFVGLDSDKEALSIASARLAPLK